MGHIFTQPSVAVILIIYINCSQLYVRGCTSVESLDVQQSAHILVVVLQKGNNQFQKRIIGICLIFLKLLYNVFLKFTKKDYGYGSLEIKSCIILYVNIFPICLCQRAGQYNSIQTGPGPYNMLNVVTCMGEAAFQRPSQKYLEPLGRLIPRLKVTMDYRNTER